ncbi:MAG: Gfo/Idh/MocA family oxidoreductase [Pirellulales bacterium]|nr:Gfo/Idh/MocA family oxidoreductase [Pirellulales bacterium]
MAVTRTIRAAVVGGGAFGECHLKTLASMPQVEIAGLYTLERDRAEILCNRYGGEPYASLGQLASDEALDLVTIATPEDAHFGAFKLLAAENKAIYVEKPLAISLDEARQMLEMSRSIIAMSGHCLRFESRLAHVFAQQDQLGRLRHMSFRDKRIQGDKAKYGRVHPAYCLLCHEIELSNAFARDRFKRVCAMETHFSAGQIDGLNILIEYHNGVTSSIEGGWYLPTQNALVENDRCTLDFEAGTFEILLPNLGFTFLGSQGYQFFNQQYEQNVYGIEFGALRAAFEYMARCIVTQSQPQISTIQDGYEAVRLVEKALESAKTGRWVQDYN